MQRPNPHESPHFTLAAHAFIPYYLGGLFGLLCCIVVVHSALALSIRHRLLGYELLGMRPEYLRRTLLSYFRLVYHKLVVAGLPW